MGVAQSQFKSFSIRNNLFKKKKIIKPVHENIGNNSSETSLTSTIASAKFPSANKDIDYLHHHHFVVKSIWSSNFNSPIEDALKNGATILDIWCGAGTFLLELSNEYPLSEFFGIDKTKLFPTTVKPHNLNFINADILEGLSFQDNYFDFVRLSIVTPRYSLDQWTFIINEVLRVTKLGGYIELEGFNSAGSNLGPNFKQFIQRLVALFTSNGANFGSHEHIKSLLSTNSHFKIATRQIQLGKNGGKLGIILEQHTTMFFRDIIGEMVAKSLNISMNDLEQDWKEVQKEFNETNTSLEAYRMWSMKI